MYEESWLYRLGQFQILSVANLQCFCDSPIGWQLYGSPNSWKQAITSEPDFLEKKESGEKFNPKTVQITLKMWALTSQTTEWKQKTLHI